MKDPQRHGRPAWAPSKKTCRRWGGRIAWMVVLWAAGVLALAICSGVLRWMMRVAAMA